ncbi:MAG: alpha/beta hydrolase fold domain-containing protein, partial [bacterium]
MRDAVELLESGNHVRPDLERLAVVGHSCGGILSANVAAIAPEFGLPAPKAVMSVEPGLTSLFHLEDLSKIPADTLLLTIVGDRDRNVGDGDAKKIFHGASQVPLENKDFIT